MPGKLPSNTFGDRMQIIIKKLGSQEKLGDVCGISGVTIGKYAADKADPSRERLVAMAEAAGVNVLWLATGEGEMLRGEVCEANKAAATEVVKPQQGMLIRDLPDRSPIKQVAVSFIDGMSDYDVSKIVTVIIAQREAAEPQPPAEDDWTRLTKYMSPEEKVEFREVLKERIRQARREEESLNNQIELRPTGT